MVDVDLLLRAMFRPRDAAAELPARQPVLLALCVGFFAPLSAVVGGMLLARSAVGPAFGSFGVLFMVVWATVVAVASMALGVALAAVFLPLGARMVGGDGSGEALGWSLAFSYSPWLFWTPFALVAQLTPVAGWAGFGLQLVMVGWVFWIQLEALGALFGISVPRALFAGVLGYGVGAMLFVATGMIGFLGFLNTVATWSPN